jgi:RecA/RadA recombinase
MEVEFRKAIQVLHEHEANPRLTTGILELDSLLAGGIELGTFSLLYGDSERFIDRILYNLTCNCQLPRERYGFDAKAILLNCGNYRQEQALLDLDLATSLLKANGLDPATGLDQIIAVSAFNIDQAGEGVEEVCNIVNRDEQVRLVVARNLAKFFIEDGIRSKETLTRIQQLQHLVGKLWQACSVRDVSLVASCRPRRANILRPSPPEGGVFLRHLVQVMVCFRKKEESGAMLAYLLKHPRRKAGMAEFSITHGDSVMGRLTIPFRSQLQQQIENLTRSFREALMEPARRDAFDSIVKAWTAEQGAMSYAKVPSVLEVMLLAAAVDNRKTIEDLQDELRKLQSHLRKAESQLAEAKVAARTLPRARE